MSTAPHLVGVLYDFPQGDGGASFETALRAGIDESAARRERPVELRSLEVRGLPAGSVDEVRTGFAELAAARVCGERGLAGPKVRLQGDFRWRR